MCHPVHICTKNAYFKCSHDFTLSLRSGWKKGDIGGGTGNVVEGAVASAVLLPLDLVWTSQHRLRPHRRRRRLSVRTEGRNPTKKRLF